MGLRDPDNPGRGGQFAKLVDRGPLRLKPEPEFPFVKGGQAGFFPNTTGR